MLSVENTAAQRMMINLVSDGDEAGEGHVYKGIGGCTPSFWDKLNA